MYLPALPTGELHSCAAESAELICSSIVSRSRSSQAMTWEPYMPCSMPLLTDMTPNCRFACSVLLPASAAAWPALYSSMMHCWLSLPTKCLLVTVTQHSVAACMSCGGVLPGCGMKVGTPFILSRRGRVIDSSARRATDGGAEAMGSCSGLSPANLPLARAVNSASSVVLMDARPPASRSDIGSGATYSTVTEANCACCLNSFSSSDAALASVQPRISSPKTKSSCLSPGAGSGCIADDSLPVTVWRWTQSVGPTNSSCTSLEVYASWTGGAGAGPDCAGGACNAAALRARPKVCMSTELSCAVMPVGAPRRREQR